jgi:hypothetical protein
MPESSGELSFRFRSPLALLGLLAVASIFAVASAWGNLISTLMNRDIAERTEVQTIGLPAAQANQITLWFAGADGDPVELTPWLSDFHWRTDLWIPELHLTATRGALPSLREIHVQVGKHSFVFDAGQIVRWKTAPTPLLIASEVRGDVVSLRIPLPQSGPLNLVNWPAEKSTAEVLIQGAMWLPVAICLCLLFSLLAKSSHFRVVASKALGGVLGPQRQSWRWTLYGFSFVLICLTFLEWRQPYYFTQDDNYAQFLSVITGACRSLFSGHLPLWNPYQFSGAPLFSLGVYALTYPFTYVAWLLAALFGNDYLTLEILSIGHIVTGYFVCVRMLARLGFRSATAACGAAAIALSGFALVFGRSWYYMIPVLVWTPLLVLAVERLCAQEPFPARAGWRWVGTTGLVIGVFFHAGNAQMWAYALIFVSVAIAISLFARRLSLKRALWSLPALLIGLALAAPLLLVEMRETADIKRVGGFGQSIAGAWLHLFLPLGSLLAHPDVWGGVAQHSARGEMFYFGFPFMLAAGLGMLLLAAVALLCRADLTTLRVLAGNNTWLICAALAWILALGHRGVLWTLMAKLPVFNKFNVPTKFLGFIVLFSVIAGGTLIERLFRDRSGMPKILAGSVMALLLVHISFATSGFYDYNGRPYEPLPAQFTKVFRAHPLQRVMTIGPDRSIDAHTAISLRNNYATAERVMTLDGYDPLVAARPEDRAAARRLDTDVIAAAKAYGARWVLVDEGGLRPRFGHDENDGSMETTTLPVKHRLAELRPILRLAAWVPGYTLYELPAADPFAFVTDAPGVSLPVQMTWSGLHVETAGIPANSRVVLNMVARPWMHLSSAATLGIPWSADKWGRLSFALPPNTHGVFLDYRPPWKQAFQFSLILLLLAVTFGGLLSFRSQSERSARVSGQ